MHMWIKPKKKGNVSNDESDEFILRLIRRQGEIRTTKVKPFYAT